MRVGPFRPGVGGAFSDRRRGAHLSLDLIGLVRLKRAFGVRLAFERLVNAAFETAFESAFE